MNNSFKDKIFNITSSKEFEKLCLELFSFQFENNPIYFQYAEKILKGNYPSSSLEIPFLPIELFKTHAVLCDNSVPEKKFKSSGTTNKKSIHLVSELNLYEKSFITCFKKFYGDPSQYTILALLPSYLESKDSSLIYMIDSLIKKSKKLNSRFYNNDIQQLANDLKKLEKKKESVLLIGVSYALLDLAENFSMNLNYTTIIETGGMKGRRRELTKEEMHTILKSAFGLKNIHSEYGMTEILSQAYSKGDGIFNPPP